MKLDGICTGIIEAPKARHILECKTHNTKSFTQLLKHGVKVAKQEHWIQCQLGMHLSGIDRAFYLAKHKDSDNSSYRRFLTVSFPTSEMQILPYNRVVRDLNDQEPEEFLRAVRERFAVSDGNPDPIQLHQFGMYLGGRWYTFDARHNEPRIGRILMARGRDATDVAIVTSFGPCTLAGFRVITEEVTSAPPEIPCSGG